MKKCIYLCLFLAVFISVGCSCKNEGIVIFTDPYVCIINEDGEKTRFWVVNSWQYDEELKISQEKKIPLHIETYTEHYLLYKSRERIIWVRFLK